MNTAEGGNGDEASKHETFLFLFKWFYDDVNGRKLDTEKLFAYGTVSRFLLLMS